MTRELEHHVQLQAPGQGAYRITVRGDEPTSNATLLSVSGAPVDLSLAPGRYTALIESLSSPGTTSRQFVIEAGAPERVEIGLGEDPDQSLSSQLTQISRPSQLAARSPDIRATFPQWASGARDDTLSSITNKLALSRSEELKSFVEDANTHLQSLKSDTTPISVMALEDLTLGFSLGVSADSNPKARGGWTAGPICVERHDAPDGELKLRLWSRDPIEAYQRRRITISVQGDAAWRTGLPLFPDGVWLMLRPSLGPKGPDVTATMRPVSEQAAILIGSLQRALPEEVNGILGGAMGVGVDGVRSDSAGLNSPAMEALYHKANDPWAAAAGALLLVRTGQSAQAIDWTLNLADRFPWLPDASVAAAWAEVAASRDSELDAEWRSLERLKCARSWGAAYFSASNVLALQMLMALAFGSSMEIRRAAKQERSRWLRHGRRAVRTGAFLAWELPSNSLQSGRLPAKTYNTIVTGTVSGSAISADVVNASSI